MPTKPEFSRLVRLEEIAASGGLTEEIRASAEECARLAARFGLLKLENLKAEVTLRMVAGAAVLVTGRLEAQVSQACVVTLEPVASKVVSQFAVRYISSGLAEGVPEEELDLDFAEEDVEPLAGDTIDIGEVVAQYLALALDPYPRKAGAEYAAGGKDGVAEVESKELNPFAILKNLKERG